MGKTEALSDPQAEPCSFKGVEGLSLNPGMGPGQSSEPFPPPRAQPLGKIGFCFH